MNIAIISPCDISVFWDYLYEDNRPEDIFKESCAPSVNTLIGAFLKEGHSVTIFTTHLINQDVILNGKHLKIHIIPSFNKYPFNYIFGSWVNAKRVKKRLQNNLENIDILHAHWTYEYAWAAGQFSKNIPVVCSVRDWAPYVWRMVSFKDKINWSFKWILNNVVFNNRRIKFVANSPYTAERIKNRWDIVAPIIPNPIKSNFIKTERHVYPGLFKIISISQSIDKRKNIEVLLYAFKEFHCKNPLSSLSLVGGAFIDSNEDVKRWGNLGLLIGVKLFGKVRHDRLMNLLDESSLLVHPALEETFGNTLIEAMARRVPVLGGINSGAVPYVLDYGNCGCLCDVSSKDDIVEKIKQIYIDKPYRDLLVSNATNLLLNRYLDIEIIKSHILLYQEVIKNKSCKR